MKMLNDIDICGTRSGYLKHGRNKQIACDPCKKANNEYSRANSHKYKSKLKETRKKWYLNNKSNIREIIRKKSQTAEYKEQTNIRDRKRRALKKQTKTEKYTSQDVLNKYGSLCHICGIAIDLKAPRGIGKNNWEMSLHLDHWIPLSKGGFDTLDNMRPAHALCNLKKGSKVLQ